MLPRVSCLGIIIQFSVGVVMQAIQVRNETHTMRLAKHNQPTLRGELGSIKVVLSNKVLAYFFGHGVNTMVMNDMDNC